MKTTNLLAKFKQVFEGDPWYGASITDIFSQHFVNPNFSIGNGNSIGQILAHIIAWRNFAIEKLSGNKDFDITPETDWQKGHSYSKTEFFQLIEDVKTSHSKLIDLITSKSDDEWLSNIVPKRSYNFEYLMEGILQHDIYHLGQIGLLRSAAERV